MPEICRRTENLFQFLAHLSDKDLERLKVVLEEFEGESDFLLEEAFQYVGLLLIQRKTQSEEQPG